MIELWHEWNSVHSFRVRVVLEEKALPWTDRRVELLKFEHLRPDYLRLNPNGVVPTLVHDGRTILESSVICQYLDESFAEPALLPREPYGRARARAWLKYFDDVVHPEVRRASFQLLYKPIILALAPAELAARLASHPDPGRVLAFREGAAGEVDFAMLREALGRFAQIVRRIDAALDDAPWLTGMTFGLADAAMAAFVERIDHLGLSRLWEPHLRGLAWQRRVLGRPSVVRSCAPQEYRFPPPPAGVLQELLK